MLIKKMPIKILKKKDVGPKEDIPCNNAKKGDASGRNAATFYRGALFLKSELKQSEKLDCAQREQLAGCQRTISERKETLNTHRIGEACLFFQCTKAIHAQMARRV